jgi:hypothetical protein
MKWILTAKNSNGKFAIEKFVANNKKQNFVQKRLFSMIIEKTQEEPLRVEVHIKMNSFAWAQNNTLFTKTIIEGVHDALEKNGADRADYHLEVLT